MARNIASSLLAAVIYLFHFHTAKSTTYYSYYAPLRSIRNTDMSASGMDAMYEHELVIELSKDYVYSDDLADSLSNKSMSLKNEMKPILANMLSLSPEHITISSIFRGSVKLRFLIVSESETLNDIQLATTFNRWAAQNPVLASKFSGPPIISLSNCLPSPCFNQGTCQDLESTFNCSCQKGFRGMQCETVDYCYNHTCVSNEQCFNGETSAVCLCNKLHKGPRCDPYCASQHINKSGFIYTFGEVWRGQLASSTEICENNGRPVASAICSNFEFTAVTVLDCFATVDSVTTQEQLVTNITSVDLDSFSGSLQLVTSSGNLTKNETEKVITALKTVANATQMQKITVLTWVYLMVVTDHVLQSTANEEFTTNDKEDIVDFIEAINAAVTLPKQMDSVVVETKYLIGIVQRTNITSSASSEEPANTKINIVEHGTDGNATDDAVSIIVSNQAVQRAAEKFKSTPHIVVVLHKNPILFPSNGNASQIVTVSFSGDVTVEELPETISIVYSNQPFQLGKETLLNNTLQVERTQLKCVFWDFTIRDWSSYGCCLDQTKFPPLCQCDHLTNFALLVARDVVPSNVALDIVSDVGCILSIIGLAITIIIHLLNRERRKLNSAQIFLNVCGNLLIVYVLFLAGIGQVENKQICTTITAFLQYFLLSTWCWMVVYSYDLYLSLVKIFRDDESHFMTKCYLFSYLLPLVVICINVGITVGYFDTLNDVNTCNGENPLATSTYRSDNMCWLHGYSLYFGFLLPVGILLLANVIFFVMILSKVIWKKSRVVSSQAVVDTKRNLMISLTLFFTMGLSWVIGYVMLLSTDPIYSLVMSWIFALTNATQGLLIFVLTCVRHKEMRQSWLGPIRRIGHAIYTPIRRRRRSYTVNTTTVQLSPSTGSNIPDSGTSSHQQQNISKDGIEPPTS